MPTFVLAYCGTVVSCKSGVVSCVAVPCWLKEKKNQTNKREVLFLASHDDAAVTLHICYTNRPHPAGLPPCFPRPCHVAHTALVTSTRKPCVFEVSRRQEPPRSRCTLKAIVLGDQGRDPKLARMTAGVDRSEKSAATSTDNAF